MYVTSYCVLCILAAAKSLQMEAIQVLTAIVKFYFHVIMLVDE